MCSSRHGKCYWFGVGLLLASLANPSWRLWLCIMLALIPILLVLLLLRLVLLLSRLLLLGICWIALGKDDTICQMIQIAPTFSFVRKHNVEHVLDTRIDEHCDHTRL